MAMQQDPIHWRYRFHRKKAYFSGLNFREYPQKIWPKIWYSTSNESDPGIPIEEILTPKILWNLTFTSLTFWWSDFSSFETSLAAWILRK
jgi:hypothetical protein